MNKVNPTDETVDTSTNNMWRSRRKDITTALTFVFLGVVLILNTTGVVSWSVWEGFVLLLLRVWPIFLIIIGIRIIFKNSSVIEWLMGFVWLVIFIGLVLFSLLFYSQKTNLSNEIKVRLPFFESFVNRVYTSGKTINDSKEFLVEPNESFSKRVLDLNLTAGEVNILDEDSTRYVWLQSEYSENRGKPVLEKKLSDQIVNFNFKQVFDNVNLTLGQRLKYDFTVGVPSLLTELKLNMTAGDGNITLKKLLLEKVTAKVTAGNLEINLKDKSLPSSMDVSLTAGNFNLKLPKDVGIKIEYKGVAGRLTIDGNKYETGTHSLNSDSKKVIEIKLDQTAGDADITFE